MAWQYTPHRLRHPLASKHVEHAGQATILLEHGHNGGEQIPSSGLVAPAEAVDQRTQWVRWLLRLAAAEIWAYDVAQDFIQESHDYLLSLL
jgi:hypothetical protein